MNENVKVVFGLIGGLALFLYGMNSMSDALQKAAGERMKKILGFLTRNPIMGALAGALVTAVLQSSSATTVMVIGFVISTDDCCNNFYHQRNQWQPDQCTDDIKRCMCICNLS